jgi:hypothetical protein
MTRVEAMFKESLKSVVMRMTVGKMAKSSGFLA